MSLKFTALEVGSGDAFLIEDEGRNILFDAGGSKRSIVKILEKDKKIKKIDLAICSHNDKDHSNGFLGLLNSKIKIGEIWLPGTWASVIHSVAGFIRRDCDNSPKRHCHVCDFLHFWPHLMSDKERYERHYDKFLSYKEEISIGQLKEDLHYINCVLGDSHLFCYRDINNDRKFSKPQCYINKLCINSCGECINDFLLQKKYRIGKLASKLMIQLDIIISIAKEALKHGVNIRWFEPQKTCTINRVHNDIIVLNADESASTIRVTKTDRPDLLMFALTLTMENEYSLAMEYLYKNIPVVRFSADSDCTCQSQKLYQNNIIITAPHHGSVANANVYKAIKGNDIIWVRSDSKSKNRPCSEFKSMNNKYCLACSTINYKGEISFEYNDRNKKWTYQKGNICSCK